MESGLVLFNAAHRGRRPKAGQASFRILGAFADEASLRAHVASASLPTDVDVLASRLGEFFVIMQEVGSQDERVQLERLRRLHKDRLLAHAEEFRENVCNQQTGAVTADAPSDAQTALSDGTPDAEMPQTVPRNAEVRNQTVAVISVLLDPDASLDAAQPGVVVWGVYDSEEAAKAAITRRLSLDVTDMHLEVVQLYEWLCPGEVQRNLDEIEEVFRDETLTELIKQRKSEKRHVKAFRNMCGERAPPLIDVSAPEVRCEGETLGMLEALPSAEASSSSHQ